MCACGPTRTKWEMRDPSVVAEEYQKKYNQPRPDCEHVVVLMLENRTFDNIFGRFMDARYQSGEIPRSQWDQDGKPLSEYSNKVKKYVRDFNDRTHSGSAGQTILKGLHSFAKMLPMQLDHTLPEVLHAQDEFEPEEYDFPVWSRDPETEDAYCEAAMGVPDGDPAEKYHLLNLCLFEKLHVPQHEVGNPTMGGFAQQYYLLEQEHLLRQKKKGIKDIEHWPDETDFDKMRSPAMHVYLPEQMGVFTELATAFGLSDTYFASCPCQTWPNRLFASTGHCYGYVNNLANSGADYDEEPNMTLGTIMRMQQFSHDTIFNKLLEAGVEYSIYAGDWPLSMLVNSSMHCKAAFDRKYKYSAFKDHVRKGQLPPFTWVEPQFLQSGDKPPNDMHPPHNTLYAQDLVADVYNTLRSNEDMWKKTLFIVNCDEGVGIFDHVKPPMAEHPGHHTTNHGFIDQHRPRFMVSNPFTRYGTRTPCLLASPLLDPGSVVRPDSKFSKYPFDHTSVIRTVIDLFVGTEYHLHHRDKVAPSLAPYLRQEARKDLGPISVKTPREPPELHPSKNSKTSGRKQCHSVGLLRDTMNDKNGSTHAHHNSLKQVPGPDKEHAEESHVPSKYPTA